jgi:hypothetical protein
VTLARLPIQPTQWTPECVAEEGPQTVLRGLDRRGLVALVRHVHGVALECGPDPNAGIGFEVGVEPLNEVVRLLVALADVRRALAVGIDDNDTPPSLVGVRSIDSLSHDRPPPLF